MAGSIDVMVYLAGDGVYNLLGQDGPDAACQTANQMFKPLWALLPRDRIMACREDLAARGVSADGKATVPANFYELLVDDMMKEGSRIYTFLFIAWNTFLVAAVAIEASLSSYSQQKVFNYPMENTF